LGSASPEHIVAVREWSGVAQLSYFGSKWVTSLEFSTGREALCRLRTPVALASGLKRASDMSTTACLRSASLFAALTMCSGCLTNFVPDPGPADPGAAPADPGAMSGVGSGGGTSPDDGGAPAADLAQASPAVDGGGGAPATDGGTPAGDMAVACDTVQSTAGLSSPSGHHNAGQECQGCHAPGGGAPTFYVGGTLYSTVTGGAAVAGATINVTDANGKKVKIISATNGNFWTTTSLAFPLQVNASLCPNTVPMNSAVGGNGACNNCHNSTFRVHLP
jgi:hypothetical protein